MSDPHPGGLTHVDAEGRAKMVDVGDKPITVRRAKAAGAVLMDQATLRLVADGRLKKGDALELARVAGIMAAKKTGDLIPLCHPLSLSHVAVEATPDADNHRVELTAEVRCEGRTGVEMEALTAVAAAALTIYDMIKAVDKSAVITDIRLLEKSGGKSGPYQRTDF
jgi:cyclic pyranopterin phosphate synthase